MSEMNINRPVTSRDIAAKLGKSLCSVRRYLHDKKAANLQTPTAILVRKTADEMGYNPQAARVDAGKQAAANLHAGGFHEKTCACGKIFVPTSSQQVRCPSCGSKHTKEYHLTYEKIRHGRSLNYYNGNFKTHEEEIKRMKELRAQGYSNAEIAKMIGRTYHTVLANIGKQDPELSKQNVAMAQHIRAQKNAARKQYLVNKPIREYNKRVEEHNKMKAEISKMEAELKPQTPAIEQAAQIQISFPLVNLHTVQPTTLQ